MIDQSKRSLMQIINARLTFCFDIAFPDEQGLTNRA